MKQPSSSPQQMLGPKQRPLPPGPQGRHWREGGGEPRAGVSRGRGGARAREGDPAGRGAEPVGEDRAEERRRFGVSLALFGPQKRSKERTQKLLGCLGFQVTEEQLSVTALSILSLR